MVNNTTLNALSQQDFSQWFARDIFFAVKPVIIGVILGIGVLGIIGNILTILVYVKMGFSETIHMSYITLAVSDIGNIVFVMWSTICTTPIIHLLFSQFRITTDPDMFASFTGAWPAQAFSKTTGLITAWISIERCLCVVFPIEVKLMITRSVTKFVLITLFLFGCAPVAFAFFGCTFEWRLDPLRNETRLFMFEGNLKTLNPLNQYAFTLYGVVYPVFSWITVTLCTAFLIAKLRKSARWRKKHLNVPANETPEGNQRSERSEIFLRTSHVTKMNIAIASVFILCSLINSIILLLSSFTDEFFFYGRLRYLFYLSALIAFLMSETNSSVNIIVFAVMGKRFRTTLKQIVLRK
ncbi:chemosensory receptor a [Plakobranchus ocellatus]|uniref:Chemosensory receptor a n=1 Tax=Plakobranchus ocellatus TaxID=259542 RepID=A0AAV4APA8_9GAST|nr:chemosensory receptor a [Plakobranchus ocellatus]